jgi:hypothetical protein
LSPSVTRVNRLMISSMKICSVTCGGPSWEYDDEFVDELSYQLSSIRHNMQTLIKSSRRRRSRDAREEHLVTNLWRSGTYHQQRQRRKRAWTCGPPASESGPIQAQDEVGRR